MSRSWKSKNDGHRNARQGDTLKEDQVYTHQRLPSCSLVCCPSGKFGTMCCHPFYNLKKYNISLGEHKEDAVSSLYTATSATIRTSRIAFAISIAITCRPV